MGTFRRSVYWKEQCDFCANRRFCKYSESVELLQARLRVVELETSGCYGSLSFWCDYYDEDTQAVKDRIAERFADGGIVKGGSIGVMPNE